MAVDSLHCVPATIERGTTVRMNLRGKYSAADATLSLAFVPVSGSPLTVSATTNADGVSFDVVLTEGMTTVMPLGVTRWGEIFTLTGGDAAFGDTGNLAVLPGFLPAEPSIAQQMVSTLEAAILKAGTSGFATVSFNGQTSTRYTLTDARSQLVYWQSRVIAEQQALSALRGQCQDNGAVGVSFGSIGGPFWGGGFGC